MLPLPKNSDVFDELKVILIKTPIVQNATKRFLKYMENTGFAQVKKKKSIKGSSTRLRD